MSNIANKTEYQALTVIALMVKEFEKLHYLEMTKKDDAYASQARKILEGIIQFNGYTINYNKNTKKPLIKPQ
jgi:hypothetical protein